MKTFCFDFNIDLMNQNNVIILDGRFTNNDKREN